MIADWRGVPSGRVAVLRTPPRAMTAVSERLRLRPAPFGPDSAAACGVLASRSMERPDLEARTAAFAAAAFRLADLVRLKPGGRRAADQLLDCATSIGANYRASARARSRDEFIAKLGTVNEESDEAVYWLEFIGNVQLADEALVAPLLDEAKQLRAIFATSCETARRNRRRMRRSTTWSTTSSSRPPSPRPSRARRSPPTFGGVAGHRTAITSRRPTP